MTTASIAYQSAKTSGISTTKVFFALAGLMLLCAGLSVFFFMPQSVRLDEAQSLWVSSRSPTAILTLIAEDVHVPLYHELLHFWRLYVGDSLVGARLMSLFFYLLSLPAIYALGSLAYNRRVGLFATILLAFSPFMNWYGNETRMYTLFLLLTILNQYLFIKLWRQPRGSRSETRAELDTWVGYGATALLGVFTHYFFFLNLAAQVAFYALHRNLFPKAALRRFIVVGVLILATFIPWTLYVIHAGEASNQVPLLSVPTTVDVFNTFSQFVLGFQNDNLNTFFLSLWPLGILVGFLALKRLRAPLSRSAYETHYFLLTVIVSFAIAFCFSIFVLPVFVSRYLIFTVPSLFLLLSAFLDAYAWRMATWALAALMLGMTAVEIINPTTPVKENYAGATAYLNEHAAAQDIVVVSVPFTLYPVEYDYRGSAPLATLPEWDQYAHGAIPSYTAATLDTEVPQLAGTHQNIWLLQSYDQGYNKEVKIYFDTHYRRLYAQNFSPGLALYEYQVRYDTPLGKASTL